MTPSAAAPKAPPLAAGATEAYAVKGFDPKKFIREHEQSVMSVTSRLGVSDSAVHMWQRRGLTPFSVYKALVIEVSPEAGADEAKRLELVRLTRAASIPEQVGIRAREYDRLYDGQRLKLHGGGFLTLKAPVEPKPTPMQVTETPAQLYSVHTPIGELQITAPAGQVQTAGATEVLLTLMMRMKAERDDALRRIGALNAEVRAERTTSESLRKQVEAAQREAREWQALAEMASNPAISATPEPTKHTPADRHEAEVLLRKHAPSLVEELVRIPKFQGQLTS